MNKVATWFMCLEVLGLVACAHVTKVALPTSTSGAVAISDNSQITFWVGSALDGRMQSGIKVTLVGPDGSEFELGVTDFAGSLRVQKSVLREHDARFVLFSNEQFFTGAFRADELALESNSSVERLIHLAAFAIP